MICKNKECRFYKTQQQQDEQQKKCFERIRNLPEAQQEKIADTYYNGRTVWNDNTRS
jgi:hypothetical protein